MPRKITWFCAALLVSFLVFAPLNVQAAGQQFARGKVLTMEEQPDLGLQDSLGMDAVAYLVSVQILSGPYKGQVVETRHIMTGTPAYDIHVSPGERVILALEEDRGTLSAVYIADNERDRHLMWLAAVFVVLLLGLGGLKGLKSLLSLIIIGIMVLFFFLPMLIAGHNPLLLAVGVSAVAIVFTIALVGGLNGKSAAAMFGTLGGVVTAGVIAVSFGGMIRASGLSSQEAQMLLFIPQGVNFDFRGLLLSGIIIGALGAVMDVGMSIASAVSEVYAADSSLGSRALFWSGMNVGRDVMGTMANTLILAYAGSSLSLLLLVTAYEIELIRLLNMDSIASEILRALAGSIGLVAAIPLTAAAAALLHAKRRPR